MSDTAEILREHLGKALWDTCTMVGIATVVGVVFGTALAVVLYLTQARLFTPNRLVNTVVGFVANAIRSLPFLILLVVLIPLIQLCIGDPYTPAGGAIALSIAAIPFFARIAESAFADVDPGCSKRRSRRERRCARSSLVRCSRRRCRVSFAASCLP